MKKVALVNPKGNIFGKNSRMVSFLADSRYMDSFKLLWTGPNLGLLTLAALLPPDWICDYIDENRMEINYDGGYDLVFIGAMTQQAAEAYNISLEFRRRRVPTVIGGIHATILPEEASQHADVVIAGEAEVLWPRFIGDLERGRLKPVYRDAGPGTYDLRNSPLPLYRLLQKYDYPLVTLQTTRGCPHDCSFCAASNVFGRKYRRKDNQQIIEELSIISDLFPGKLILFADDNLFVKRKESKDLLQAMRDMDLRWIAQTDISIAGDTELLTLMTRAGCQWVVIGFESVLYDSLRNLDRKNWKLKQHRNYAPSIEILQSYGIGVYGTFIVGLDHDGPDVFKKTADFITGNNLYGANITVPTPLPGTRLREEMIKSGRIQNYDWDYYTLWDVTFEPARFTREELEDGLLEIYYKITDDSVAQKRLSYLHKLARGKKSVIGQSQDKRGIHVS